MQTFKVWLIRLLFPLAIVVLILGGIISKLSHEKEGAGVTHPSSVSRDAGKLSTPHLSPGPAPQVVVPPSASGSTSEAKKIDISSWMPDITRQTWLMMLLFLVAAILAHAKKWITAAVAFAAGAALLMTPSINTGEIASSGGSAIFGLLPFIRAYTAEWGPQQWLALAAGVLGVILLLPSRTKPSEPVDKRPFIGAALLAVAAILLIVQLDSFSGDQQGRDWKGAFQEMFVSIANPLPANCNSETDNIPLTTKEWPLPKDCPTMIVRVYQGTVHLEDSNGKPFEIVAGTKAVWPEGFKPILVRGGPSAKAKFIFRPT